MSDLSDAAKRLLLGRPVRSDRLGHTLLPKRIALPVFASDALSSVAYAPDEILLTLSLAGMAALVISPWVGLAVVAVMLVVVASYRQNVHAYPSGGGDYEVATTNLGPERRRDRGQRAAGRLRADGRGVDLVRRPVRRDRHPRRCAGTRRRSPIGLVVLLTVVNLRGVKESGSLFALPVYLFMLAIGSIAVVGVDPDAHGQPRRWRRARASSSRRTPRSTRVSPGWPGSSSSCGRSRPGCAALTGVEAISNGVPAFKKPKSKNAATTLALLGGLSIVMIMSILLLSRATGVVFAEDPHDAAARERRAGGRRATCSTR